MWNLNNAKWQDNNIPSGVFIRVVSAYPLTAERFLDLNSITKSKANDCPNSEIGKPT